MSTSYRDFGSRTPEGRNHPAGTTLTSGFGTVLNEERELKFAIEAGIVRAQDGASPDLLRILREHHRQVETILATLAARSERLPLPARFAAVQSGESVRTHAQRSAWLQNEADTLPTLIALHDALARHLSRLSDGGSGPAAERSLADAVRQHEEMSWMLNALINDRVGDRGAPAGRISSVVAEPGMSEAEWENEGGAALPIASTVGSSAWPEPTASRNRRNADGSSATSTPRITTRY